MSSNEDNVTKKDLQNFKEEIIDQFHIASEGLVDQIKLLAEGHTGISDRLVKIEGRLDRMEKENERQHLETRALVKISFSELDRRLSDLDSQVKDLQDWRKKVETKLQVPPQLLEPRSPHLPVSNSQGYPDLKILIKDRAEKFENHCHCECLS